jgi:hypothetical protein
MKSSLAFVPAGSGSRRRARFASTVGVASFLCALGIVLGLVAPLEAQAEDTFSSATADASVADPPPSATPDAAAVETIPALPSPTAPVDARPPKAPPPPPTIAAVIPVAEEAPPEHALGWEPFRPWVVPPEGVSTSAYAQLQYESHQDSRGQLFQGGALQNKDRFVVRRARLVAAGEWQYTALVLELDANTVSGSQVDLKKAEGSLQYRPDRKRPALVIGTLGLFDTPFGYELVEIPRTRWFMEPSTAARALWPGGSDVGLRLAGAVGFFRWTLAALNGHPQGESSPYALQDPIATKDVVVRVGVDVAPLHDLHVAGGISSTRGKGFHPGTDVTKPSVQWSDTNRDGVLQLNEVMGVPGQAATPSRTFDRSALGADLRVQFRWRAGVTKAYGELFVAQNMDRGLFVADPTITHVDQRELGYYVGLVQEIGRLGAVGFRYDVYDPNSDAFDTRQARLLPYDQAITTYAPVVAVTLPAHARLSFEYDFVKNALGRDSRGVPASLAMSTWALRLQVQQ